MFCPWYLEWWLDSNLHLVLFIQYILNCLSSLLMYMCIIWEVVNYIVFSITKEIINNILLVSQMKNLMYTYCMYSYHCVYYMSSHSVQDIKSAMNFSNFSATSVSPHWTKVSATSFSASPNNWRPVVWKIEILQRYYNQSYLKPTIKCIH